jgi:hypothetical protein
MKRATVSGSVSAEVKCHLNADEECQVNAEAGGPNRQPRYFPRSLPQQLAGTRRCCGGDWLMIQERIAQGVYIKDIAEELGVHPRTVSRAIERSAAPPGRRPAARGSKLDAYMPAVDRLLKEGAWNARVIFRKIQAAGYQGGAASCGPTSSQNGRSERRAGFWARPKHLCPASHIHPRSPSTIFSAESHSSGCD